MRTLGFLAARAFLLAVGVLSATYALIAYIPFTYQAVLRAGLLSWLPAALAWQPWAFLAALLANAAADRAGSATKDLPRSRWIFYACFGAGALLQILRPVLPRLQGGPAGGVWSVVFLLGILVLLALDLVEASLRFPGLRADADEGRRLALASGLAALSWSLLSFAIGQARAHSSLPVPAAFMAFGWSLTAHGLLFLMGAVAVFGLQAAARFFRRILAVEFALILLSGAVLIGALFQTVVFPGIAFTGPFAAAVSFLLGLCLMAFLGLSGLRLHPVEQPVGSALDLFLRPLGPPPGGGALLAAWGLALMGLATFLAFKVPPFDWNFLFQQLGAALVATLILAAFYLRIAPRPTRRSWSGRLFGATLIALLLFKAWATPAPPVAWSARFRPQTRTLEIQAGFDASARLAAALLRPVERAEASIYRTLLENSNIPQSVHVDPLDLKLADPLTPGAGPRPDIYIFVVDSLRQDYLGAYNKAVTFTPGIDRFAAESTVLRNAFTRYGATGLSEPSIWVGGMILHKQYITPFYPMNTLQKLVRADGYAPYLSMDSILEVVVQPTPDIIQLDKGRGTSELRMATTVQELKARLDHRPDDRPVFFYGQCQDIHISSINREGKDVPGGGSYPGFYAPYASRVQRLDQSFGDFIQYLKDRGRYDNSIVILTADHGDSLGEDGRFGHAYTIFPEVLRVPLILHVPEALRSRLVVDPSRAAFLTDITPSLYYLLGHRALASDPVLGRPLFTETEQEQRQGRRDHHLVASSYGAVYGILSDDGGALYIADGVNLTDHYYDLRRDPKGTRNALTPELKRRYDQLILDEIKHLNAFYKFRSGS